MRRSRTKKKKGIQVPIFVKKLIQIMENQPTQHIVSWTTTADSFIIKSITKFTEQILPTYWKHRNFSSFIRQLNMYGFKKSRHTDGENVYLNEDFRAGSKQLLKNIERKMHEDKDEVMPCNGSSLRNEGVTVKEINELKGRQHKLQQMCKHFIFENQRLIEQNKNIVNKMEQESNQKEERLEEFLYCIVTHNKTRQITTKEISNLSLTNSEHVPLQPIFQQIKPTTTNNLSTDTSQESHVKRVQHLLQQIYFRRNPQPTENSTTIPKQEQKPYFELDEMRNELIDMPSVDQPQNQYFLSINDFLNVNEPNDIDLSASP